MQFINDAPPATQNYLAINPKLNTEYNFIVTTANNLPVINNQMKTDGITAAGYQNHRTLLRSQSYSWHWDNFW